MSSVVISGDTSGSITLAAPAVAGTNTINLPAAAGTVMVSGNMPAFSAYQSSAQTLSTGTTTKILFQTEEYDTNNNFASSAFTPTVAGYYQISANFAVSTVATRMIIDIYKNGSQHKRGNDSTSVANTGSCIVYCNGSTDYVEVYGYVAAGQSLQASSTATWFQGVLVRSA